ncbi:MAG: TetR/AcrR family transcriptional regulator [Actinocatenispora sp.]
MPPPTAAERGREVRGRLLEAAAQLIPELGWNAVSTRILADRAGATPGLVHYHFDSLQGLLREAAMGVIRGMVAGVEEAFAQAPDLDTGMAMLMGSLDGYSGVDPTSVLFTETYLAATRDDRLRAELAEVAERFRHGLTRWLAAADVDGPAATATVLTAAIDGIMLHRSLNQELTSAAVTPVLRRLLTSTSAHRTGARREEVRP